jgi:PIN domain nuclease of toxin-antitoxin system
MGSPRVVPAEGLLLLDTHVWIWLNIGDTRRLGKKAIQRMTRAAGRGALRLSIISVWEIGLLHARGQIRFSTSLDEWVRAAVATPGLTLTELTPDIALDASRLPGDLHPDPVDRILTSTARQASATLVTRDERLLGYAADGWIKALNAGA